MTIPFKYLISLAFLVLCAASSPTKVQSSKIGTEKSQEKGPVYHPLRVKPYSKLTMKA